MTKTIDYDVVSEIAGHQPNRGVEITKAVEDIYGKCKNKAMQCAINGEFVEFDTMTELQDKLIQACDMALSVRCFDQNIGG